MPETQSGQERSEEPTPRRLEKSHAEGKVARSQELSGAAVLLAGTMVLSVTGGGNIARYLASLMEESTSRLSANPIDLGAVVALLRAIIQRTMAAVAPIILGTMAIALLVNVIQARGVLSLKPVEAKLKNVSPLSGLKRIFSWQSPFTLVKSILKLVFLVTVTYLTMRSAWPEIAMLSARDTTDVLLVLRRLTIKVTLATGICYLVISAMDYLFQAYQHKSQQRMTKQEVIEEFKDIDGDPLLKSRIRSLALAMSRQRMLHDVPDADVVVATPTHLAIALKYDPDDTPAPMVLTMGRRKMAERIKAMARAAGIPVVENRPLAETLLATATVGQPIPPALYAAVAEVLAFVYRRLNRNQPRLAARTAGARS